MDYSIVKQTFAVIQQGHVISTGWTSRQAALRMNILTHGHDISEWDSVPFVAGKMQIMATDMEKAIRDIGVLRSARADLLTRARNYLENGGFFNPEMMEHEKVRDLIIAMAAELNWTL